MKFIKNVLALVIAGAILFGLFTFFSNSTPADTMEQQELTSLLNGLIDNDQDAMDQVKAAGALAEWSERNQMSKTDTKKVLKQWLKGLTPEQRAQFKEKLTEIGLNTGDMLLNLTQDITEKLLAHPDPSEWLDALADKLFGNARK